jgi:hypothetical protein
LQKNEDKPERKRDRDRQQADDDVEEGGREKQRKMRSAMAASREVQQQVGGNRSARVEFIARTPHFRQKHGPCLMD